MVNSIRKRRKSGGEQSTCNEGGTESTNTVNPKLDKMAWINFHKQERQIKNGKGNKKSMDEIRKTWNNLSIDEKSKYNMRKEDIVDEKGHFEEGAEDSKVLPFDTRCTPVRFTEIVSNFSDLQKDVVRELGFSNLIMLKCGRLRRDLCGWLVSKFDTTNLSIDLHGKRFTLDASVFSHIMGISDRGDIVHFDTHCNDVWRSKFAVTNRGIKLPHLQNQLKNIKKIDDEFKISFCLYLMGTVLAPAAGEYVDSRYLNVVGDVKNIRGKNWARWCFDQLVSGIEKFNCKRSKYISGCLLFLQLFYFHIIHWQPPIVDKRSLPVVSWTSLNIKKCMKMLREQGGYGSCKVTVIEYVAPDTAADDLLKAEHNIPTDGALQKVLQEIQNFRKEIAQFRTEHTDLIKKVDSMEEKVNSLHANIKMDEQPKQNDGFEPTTDPLTPTLNSDDDLAAVAKDFDFKFDHDQPPEHTSFPSVMDEKKRNIIVKTLAEQSSTSINVVKNTRTSSKRKPSRYKRSPYDDALRTGKQSKFPYGPFLISAPLKTLDAQIIEYVFSTDLPMSETIVATNRIIVNRKSFRTLAPTEWVDSEIISLVADNNTSTARRKRGPLSWYLPTQFAYISLTSQDGRMGRLSEIHSHFKEDYMYDFHRCERIYIPINNLKGHWYTAVVIIKERKVQIWDSLPSRRRNDQSRVKLVRRLLKSLDYVLETEINTVFGSSFAFERFSIESALGPTQPNEYDCGVFVCMFMNEDSVAINPQIIATYNSDNQRLLLARQLVTFHTNTCLEQLKEHAIQHAKLATIGSKRPLPPLQSTRRAKVVKTLS